MPESSAVLPTKKINDLTEEQWKRVPIVREEWRAIGLSTEPIDHNAAREAVRTLYEKSGLASPKVLIFSSPMGALLARCTLASILKDKKEEAGQLGDQLRDQLGDQLWFQLRNQFGNQLGDQLWDQLRVQLWDQLWFQLRDQLGNQLGDQLWGQLRDQLWLQLRNQLVDQLGDQLRDQFWDQLGDQLGQLRDQLWDQLRDQFGTHFQTPYFLGGQDAAWLAFYSFGQEIGAPYQADTAAKFVAYRDYAKTCGWMFPYNGIAFLSDRPSSLSFDAQRRLHNDSGPAVRFRDGWDLHAWHGYRVPSWVIEEKHRLSPKVISDEKNAELRRVMFEIYGAERFIRETSAKLLSEDVNLENPRKLYEAQVGSDRIRILHVVNHSLEPNGSKREFWLGMPDEVQTPHEAVAMSFGFRPEHYREACAT